ncbi:MAG: hypothetical protein IKO99_09745 [Bacteroidales bacterium]|nr:hypothetical protein [Bacteroidales bacterium]MCR4559607.1 hypothetical protein [Bacteroidales bacterium]
MIKITMIEKPSELTAENEAELVRIYKATGKPVWRKKYIVDALLKMTNSKCAYSELKLNEGGKYMEVDHFKCKKNYPDEVVRWGNLLPCCKKCNSQKRSIDVNETPIVNPLIDNPKDYLYIKGLRYYAVGNNQKGVNTIINLGLNDESHFIKPKWDIVLDIEDKFKLILCNPQNDVSLRILKKLFKKCRPKYGFSAAISTYILYDSKIYPKIETYLRQNNLWDDELEQLKTVLLEIAMPKLS